MTKKNTSLDDSAMFRAAIGKVKKIDTNTVLLKPEQKPRVAPRDKLLDPADPLQNTVDETLETLFQEDRMTFLAPGLQKNILKKLRKRHFGVDAEIDLHGLTSYEAQKQLLHFLYLCIEDGYRCVQLIHGKGYNSPSQPVLKNDLNLWLRQHKDVLAFCSTPQRAGGAGALYVLLKLSDKFGDGEDDLALRND